MEVREGCGPLEHTRRWRGQIPLRTTLSQIPLKSCGFPGAESARKRFFLRGASPRSEKISARGRPTEIFDFAWSVAKRLACPLGKQPFRRAGRRPRLEVERVHTLSRSPGAVLAKILVPDDAGCPFGDVVSDSTCVGRSAPLHPLGGRGARGCDPLALSRGCSGGDFGFRRSGLFFCGRCFRPCGCGALCSPTPPRVTGVREGCAFEGFVFDDAGYAFDGFCFRRRGRGALCSPAPLG